MSEKSTEFCRLCSASENLICMFTGKQRKIRNDLRKIIKETVNVQIEQDSDVLSVCFNCLVDVTHFYYFRLQCHLNQKNLKAKLTDSRAKRRKRDCLTVDQLTLPDIDSTSNILEWLVSKRKNIPTDHSNSESQQKCERVEYISKECQTCDVELKSRSIQTALELSEKSVQTENTVISRQERCVQASVTTKNSYCQTVNILNSVNQQVDKKRSSGTKQLIPKNHHADKWCQTDFISASSIIHSSRADGDLAANVTGRTNITDDISKIKNNEKSAVEPDEVLENHRSTICKGRRRQSKRKSCQMDTGFSVSKKTQTFSGEFADKSTQYRFRRKLSIDSEGITVECQTDMSINPIISDTLAYNYLCEKDFKYHIDEFKVTLKDEKLSPLEQLKICTTPPHEETLPSPSSSTNLLQIKEGKSDTVFMCPWCDKMLYNKRELGVHKRAHLHCPICKRKFRSVEKAQLHISSCKLAMLNTTEGLQKCNFDVYVQLVRLEQQAEVMRKFPEIFI